MAIGYLAEFPDIFSDNSVPYIETPISITAARAANAPGSATVVVPDFMDRRSLTWNTRMRLWRRGRDGTRALFGNTEWFLRSITHDYADRVYSMDFEDALSLLNQRLVAYTSETPYADKTLEELGLIVPNDTLRIDNMMRAYVRENYSSLVLDADRNNPYIRVEEDKGFAPHGEMTAAWKVLGDVLSELAKQSADKGLELFYDLIPQPDDTLLFVVRSKVLNVDRGSDSKRILTLSEDLNQLTEVVETEDFREVGSYAYVLGYDSGPSQVVIDVLNGSLITSNRFGRVEFTESTPEDYKESVLIDIGRAALQGRRPRRSVSARVVEGVGIVYGRDYSYGDRLMVHVEERKYNCHVHAVSARWEAGQEDLEVRLNGYDEDAFPSFMLPGPHTNNTAPVVDAGPDQDIASMATATLVGGATDDGNPDPPDALTYQWSKVSGPGIVTFGDASDPTTTADFDTDGTYVLRLTVSDSALVDHDDITIVVGEEPLTPPSFGLFDDTELVCGITRHGSLVRTSNFLNASPTWDQFIFAEADLPSCADFVVDPFSPGYRGVSGGAINGFVICQADTGAKMGIYKVVDMFAVTPTSSNLYTSLLGFTTSGAIAASFGRFEAEETDNPWIMAAFVSNAPGVVGTDGFYINYSRDGGQTWSGDILVDSLLSGSDSSIRQRPSVWLSPRTPGLGIVFAFDTTTTTTGYITTDWGATWTEALDPLVTNVKGFGGCIHVPWEDNEDEQIVYYGTYDTTGNVWKIIRVTGTLVEDISPNLDGDSFGLIANKFAVRAFDNDRQIMVFGGGANSSTGFPDRWHLFFSTDAGTTWVSKKELDPDPQFGDGLPGGGWKAAFSANNSDFLYVWGAKTDSGIPLIESTDDFGATYDDRTGNLVTLAGVDEFEAIHSIVGGPLT